MKLLEVLSTIECESDLKDDILIIKASIEVNGHEEVRDFYIVYNEDSVIGIYDATANLNNFQAWDPNKTMLYKQLVNVCMMRLINK